MQRSKDAARPMASTQPVPMTSALSWLKRRSLPAGAAHELDAGQNERALDLCMHTQSSSTGASPETR